MSLTEAQNNYKAVKNYRNKFELHNYDDDFNEQIASHFTELFKLDVQNAGYNEHFKVQYSMSCNLLVLDISLFLWEMHQPYFPGKRCHQCP